MSSIAAKKVFDFSDFREYLKYRYQELKPFGFSHREFAKKAGFNAPNYLKLVMDGKRGISDEAALKFGEGLGLEADETEYFVLLASYNQSNIPVKKKLYLNEMRMRRLALGITSPFVETSD